LIEDIMDFVKDRYVGVGELDDVQLFYYFVESGRSPKDDPLVLWLTGGPGCSAFSGLVYEIGMHLIISYVTCRKKNNSGCSNTLEPGILFFCLFNFEQRIQRKKKNQTKAKSQNKIASGFSKAIKLVLVIFVQ
jgi:hypothetical protein